MKLIRNIYRLIRATVDRRELQRLYDERSSLMPDRNNRTPTTMVVCLSLLVMCLSFVLYITWTRGDLDHFLASNENINSSLVLNHLMQSTEVSEKSCGNAEDCDRYFSGMEDSKWNELDLASQTLATPKQIVSSGKTFTAAIRFKPELSQYMKTMPVASAYVLLFPKFRFEKATLFSEGKLVATFFDGERLTLRYPLEGTNSKNSSYLLILETSSANSFFWNSDNSSLTKIEKQFSFMTLGGYRSLENFIAVHNAGKGSFVGSLARIVMGIMLLLLFMAIDGSPETLGLALMMGFEGIAISLGLHAWLPQGISEFAKHFCFQMGDIFRIYFFIQMARMMPPAITKWLIYGTLITIPYAWLRTEATQHQWAWAAQLSVFRDSLAGAIGLVVCARTFYFLQGKGLPWRQAALLLAGFGAFEQFFETFAYFNPAVGRLPYFQEFSAFIEPLSAYLLAFSAFINISTLENRVRILTGLYNESLEIAKDMELGENVQKTFLKIPEMPEQLDLVGYHKALRYVSGDTFFAYHDKQRSKFWFFINDVTGHGVQAALKSSGVSVLAQSAWDSAAETGLDPFVTYAAMVRKFYSAVDSFKPDVLAFGGAEFNCQTGVINLYRENFPFPILISPRLPESDEIESRKTDLWTVKLISTPHQKNYQIELPLGSFVIILSDGIADGSQEHVRFLRYLRANFGAFKGDLSAEMLKSACVEFSLKNTTSRKDDQTMLVFHWKSKFEEQVDVLPVISAA